MAKGSAVAQADRAWSEFVRESRALWRVSPDSGVRKLAAGCSCTDVRELAELLGVTAESVVASLDRLRRRGLVRMHADRVQA